jgi:hypothetical protein
VARTCPDPCGDGRGTEGANGGFAAPSTPDNGPPWSESAADVELGRHAALRGAQGMPWTQKRPGVGLPGRCDGVGRRLKGDVVYWRPTPSNAVLIPQVMGRQFPAGLAQHNGQRVEFSSFAEFVATPQLEGLGATVDQLRDICRRDPEALGAISQVTENAPGRPKKNDDIVIDSEQGNSTEYALRRLRKSRPDLHAAVLAGGESPHAAMVEAGFRPNYGPNRAKDRAADQRAAIAAEALPTIEAETEARRRVKQAATQRGGAIVANSPQQAPQGSGASRRAAAEQFKVSEHKVRQAKTVAAADPTSSRRREDFPAGGKIKAPRPSGRGAGAGASAGPRGKPGALAERAADTHVPATA